jgi:hypothetical protein
VQNQEGPHADLDQTHTSMGMARKKQGKSDAGSTKTQEKTRKGAAPPCKSLSTLLHAAVSAAGTRDL